MRVRTHSNSRIIFESFSLKYFSNRFRFYYADDFVVITKSPTNYGVRPSDKKMTCIGRGSRSLTMINLILMAMLLVISVGNSQKLSDPAMQLHSVVHGGNFASTRHYDKARLLHFIKMKMTIMKKMGTMAGKKNLKRKRNKGRKGQMKRKQRPKKRAGGKRKRGIIKSPASVTKGLELEKEERPHNVHESQGSESMSKTSSGDQSDDFEERIKDLLRIDDEAENVTQAPERNSSPKEDPHDDTPMNSTQERESTGYTN